MEARLDYGIQLIKSETPSGVVRVSPRLVAGAFFLRPACRDRLRLKADRLERRGCSHCWSEARETLRVSIDPSEWLCVIERLAGFAPVDIITS